jgi:hypothetical protein
MKFSKSKIIIITSLLGDGRGGGNMKTSLLIMYIPIITILSSCFNQQNHISDKVESPMTCHDPPQSFNWNSTIYYLKTIGDRELEPGMKIGFLACDNGVYTEQAEGPNATYNIYTFGSPLEKNLLYFGKWGRALYTSK